MPFWVRNNLGVEKRIDDLGQAFTASEELDLYDISTIAEVNESAAQGDLKTAEAAGDISYLDGPAGSPIPPEEVSIFYVTQDELDAIGGSGITEAQHRDVDQLVHLIAEDSFLELTYSGNNVQDAITWTDNGKTIKIREVNITYTGNKATTVVTKQYNAVGALVETYTETIAYSGQKVDTVTGVLT